MIEQTSLNRPDSTYRKLFPSTVFGTVRGLLCIGVCPIIIMIVAQAMHIYFSTQFVLSSNNQEWLYMLFRLVWAKLYEIGYVFVLLGLQHGIFSVVWTWTCTCTAVSYIVSKFAINISMFHLGFHTRLTRMPQRTPGTRPVPPIGRPTVLWTWGERHGSRPALIIRE